MIKLMETILVVLVETILLVLRPAVMTRGVMEPVGSEPASKGDLGNSLNLAKKRANSAFEQMYALIFRE